MRGNSGKKYRIICHVSIVLLAISIGCNLVGGAYLLSGTQATSQLEEEILEETINFTEETLQAYAERYYSKQLKKLLTEEEMMYVTQRQWEYVLSANGKEFTSNTLYLEGAQNIRIMLAEVAKDSQILPPDLLKQGSMWQSDEEIEITDYIKIYSTIPYEVGKEEQDGNIKYYYEFKEIKPGTIITFQMGELLREKLRYSDNIKGNRVEVIIR